MTLAVLAVATFLAGAAIGLLAVFVIGIRSDDHAKNLTNTPRTHVEAATRRVLGVGVRNGNADRNERGKE